MPNMIGGIISLTLGILLISNVFLQIVHDQNQSGWSAAETSMWSVLGLGGVIGLVYGTFNVFGLVN